jgi:putative CocE/NonD family hydrolase
LLSFNRRLLYYNVIPLKAMDMKDNSLYEVQIRYNLCLPTRDGLELSANLFLPVERTPGEKFPAILEMIPYRKDDWRASFDRQLMTYFAQRGFAGCRVDVRGTGSSQGVALDEYTEAETQDGYDAVEWLAAQPWCNGQVGMWGISYGGFTSIQVAKLQPPHLKAIVPMYATDDRYLDDVHYVGGCKTVSDWAQYALGMVAMNAMPPHLEYAGPNWAEMWKQRLEATPPWVVGWLRQQTDGLYWRRGSLAPDYERITCAMLLFAGWADPYPGSALRMMEKCVNSPRKLIAGPWSHEMPSEAYPGPNIDYLHEMARFFGHWLKGEANGVMEEPAAAIFRSEYTPPEAFPKRMNGEWISEAAYPPARTVQHTLYLGEAALSPHAPPSAFRDPYPHRPAHGTHAALCWGAGSPPTGLARDLRPDEALSLTYTGEPLAEPLDVIGLPEAVLHISSTAPVAHVVVRLTDVAPDGTSALVTTGILNLTHRDSHAEPQPLTPGEVYEVRVPFKGVAYRWLPGHRVRLSVASAYWPVIFPSPYRADHTLHCGPATPSRVILPVMPPAAAPLPAPAFKTTPPELIAGAGGNSEPAVWQVVEDVIEGSVTVRLAEADTTTLPDSGATLATSERIEMTAYHDDPAHARMFNEEIYRLIERGYDIHVVSTGTLRATETAFQIDVQLVVNLNGAMFFQKSWLESVPRRWM